MLLSAERSVLLLVDLQERLLPAIAEAPRVIRNGGILLEAARELQVPVLASEQYPRGLGPTVPDLARRLPAGSTVEKLAFACTGEPAFVTRLGQLDRPQIVVAGVEAHVCVLQTALGLQAAGYAPAVVADAVSSRAPASVEQALARLRANGIETVTTEMVIFEWLGRAGTPAFKAVSALIR